MFFPAVTNFGSTPEIIHGVKAFVFGSVIAVQLPFYAPGQEVSIVQRVKKSDLGAQRFQAFILQVLVEKKIGKGTFAIFKVKFLPLIAHPQYPFKMRVIYYRNKAFYFGNVAVIYLYVLVCWVCHV